MWFNSLSVCGHILPGDKDCRSGLIQPERVEPNHVLVDRI